MIRWGGLTFRKAETAAVRKNSNRMGTEEEKESWKKGDERGAGAKGTKSRLLKTAAETAALNASLPELKLGVGTEA